MRQTTWILAVAVGCLMMMNCMSEAKSIVKREDVQNNIDPTKEEIDSDDQDREKRSQNHPIDPKWGAKSAVIGFVFNPKNTRFAWDQPTTTTTPKGPTTTEDIVIYEQGQSKVELDIPDELFGSGFTLLTNLSQTAGDLITNTALRTQRLLESMRPFLRSIFGAKGIVIEATTDKPIFSDPNSR
ncbi:uncharacterized protein LOC123684431 isoform X2 [Harmonia axyridis]|uniref:uncharacterized protein LOC123684431 isoform X2 n=1 Tax=Harmonia axyridis TaxID=115357 RepID=UPI001E276B5E|nr:uncharacterized protein LOC123684431 isoform X2 [Harmonia axyridis]